MSRVVLMTNFSMPVLNPDKVGNHDADCKHCGKSILTLIAKKKELVNQIGIEQNELELNLEF